MFFLFVFIAPIVPREQIKIKYQEGNRLSFRPLLNIFDIAQIYEMAYNLTFLLPPQ